MIDLSHVVTSPAALLMAALALICIARVLFRLAFRIVIAFAVIGVGAVVAGAAQAPAGFDLQSLAMDLQAAVHQAVNAAGNMLHAGGPS